MAATSNTSRALSAVKRIRVEGSNLQLDLNEADNSLVITTTGITAGLRMREEDGSPDIASVSDLIVPSDSLTDDGGGTATLQLGINTNITIKGGKTAPPLITSDQNNYNPTGLSDSTMLALSTDATRTITGLAGGQDNREIVIVNVGTNPIVLSHEDAASTAANRFDLPGDADATIQLGTSYSLLYDASISRWRSLSGSTSGSASGNSIKDFITPPDLTGDVNDYNPTGLADTNVEIIYIDNDNTTRNITGIANGTEGRLITLVFTGGTNDINLVNESASSLAPNRMFTGAGRVINGGNRTASLIYTDVDGTGFRWILYTP